MKRRIVLDFDETITVDDTTDAILLAGLDLNKDLPSNITYDYIMDDYDAIYNMNLTDPTYKKLKKKKGTTQKYRDEYVYQAASDPYEALSVVHFQNMTIFDGVNVTELVDEVASSVTIRSGFSDFLEKIDLTRLFILSLNFSRDVISHFVPGIADESIFCDALISANGTYTGDFEGKMLTGSDKCNKLFAMGQKKKEEVWYVGDSRSDYLSVLHPYVKQGFIIIDSNSTKKLTKACSFFNITNCTYGDITDNLVEQAWLPKKTKKQVHLVSSWKEIIDQL